jgi:ribosomal protein S18 acetylase RimI-like enzyme
MKKKTTSEVVVRRMKKSDLPRVGPLAEQLVRLHHHWDAKRFFVPDDPSGGYQWWFGSQLAKKTTVLLVAETDGELAGYLYGAQQGREWNMLLDACGAIHDIFVAKEHRRKGIARLLMAAGLKFFEDKGITQVVLSTSTQNAEGRALFESLGFRATMLEMTRDA